MLKYFRLPFATTGDKTAVPDAVDSNGNVSYSQGYGFDYQRQKTDPAAKNIERDKMNQIFFDMTTAIAELQSQGVPDFITTALNGGTAYSYGQYAVVKYSGDLYISLVAANTALPSDATKWALLPTPARIQAAFNSSAVATGTADAILGAFTPAIAALPAAPGTLSVFVRAGGANLTATPTFEADGTAAKTIVKGANQALVAGDIAGAGHWLELQYDATLDKWILQNPAQGVASTQHGQCRLVKSGANLLLSPFNGNKLIIGGFAQSIPSAGVSLAPTGLTPSTLYYVYAYLVGATVTLEASATGHSTDATTGVEIKTGDATRTLVGMAYVIAGPAFADTAAQRFVISWFNRRAISGSAKFTALRTMGSSSFVEINTEIRNQFLTWGDEAVSATYCGSWYSAGVSPNVATTAIGYDGTATRSNGVGRIPQVENNTAPVSVADSRVLSEGLHYATLIGRVSNVALTITYNGATLADDDNTLQVMIRG